jgi:hypothetical protein
LDSSTKRLAAARVDARSPGCLLDLPGPPKRGTGGTLDGMKFLLRPGPPAMPATA